MSGESSSSQGKEHGTGVSHTKEWVTQTFFKQEEDTPIRMENNEEEVEAEELGEIENREDIQEGDGEEVGDDEIDEGEEEEEIEDDDPEPGSDLSVNSDLDIVDDLNETGFEQPVVCSCKNPETTTAALTLMESMLDEIFTPNNLDCHIDNIVRCLNIILKEEHNNIVSVYKIACIDLFYRLRHEIMFNLVTWTFKLPSGKSDMCFSEFGIDSNRTPDLIYDYNNILFVFEVAVVGNKERGAQSKGVEEFGFEGKYKKEIDMLNEKGLSTKYFPIIFNMNDIGTPYSINQMESISAIFPKSKTNYTLMISKAKTFCMISQDIREHFVLSSTLLFSKLIEIPCSHSSHKFLYDRSNVRNVSYNYDTLVVSPYVYRKLDEQWARLEERLLSKDFRDDEKISFQLDLITNKFVILKDPKGPLCSEFLQMFLDNNKLDFLRNLVLTTNYGSFKATENEKGVKFFLQKKLKLSKNGENSNNHFKEITLFLDHTPIIFDSRYFNINNYQKYVDSEEGMHYNYFEFDNDYEELLINSIRQFDFNEEIEDIKSLTLLGFKNSSKIDISSVMDTVIDRYKERNSTAETMPIKIYKMKSPFILPLSSVDSFSYSSLEHKNTDLYMHILNCLPPNSNYLKRILESLLNPEFVLFHSSKAPSKIYTDLKSERIKISNQINMLQKSLYKEQHASGISLRISKTQDPNYKNQYLSLKKEYNRVNKQVLDRGKMERIKDRQGFIRLPTKGKGQLSSDFKDEMEHFKSKKAQSTIEGVGIREGLELDYKKEMDVFNNINNRLVTYCGKNMDPLIDDKVYSDVTLLKDLKQIAIDNYKPLMEQVKNSQLGHSSAFVSRLCHTLMYLSQQPFNSDYIKVDNLGYNNVLLIVRGGKKIFKSKSSKLFRLLLPILPESLPWYNEGRQNKGSIHIIHYKNKPFLLTPWIMLHESILTDGISFYPRVCSFTILNLDHRIKLVDQYNKVALNVLLAFHNRRQTEVILANMRYILLSTLGDFTGVDEILDEFFGFNYDCFQSFIRNCIVMNYKNYFQTLQRIKSSKTKGDITVSEFNTCRLKNIFTNHVISGTEDLALMIYSTFLMTKAPYQRSVERANNLKGILKIHELYDQTIGLKLTPEEQYNKISVKLTEGMRFSDYAKDLFENDFNIDPKFCALVGNFINSELNDRGLKDEIYNKWYSILNSSWDEMSTSTGLRGHYDQVELFWGQKGYFVVYKDLLNDPVFITGVQNLILGNNSSDEKRKQLRLLNQSYHSKLGKEGEFLIFHAVDKSQWKGSREIYVMDIDTKLIQQPIEKFMGFLCQKLDNELISIPSDKRSQVIHHSIFEKDLPLKDTLTWYLTLDCTKWAPKSVFVKFITMFLPMDIIPNSFKRHFMNYSEKLFLKRIYFNTQEVEVLKNNQKYAKACEDYLIKDDKVNGYYLLMPYSWVMGIFNYTSSFLHAANQKYMSYIIMKTSILSYQEETSLFMFAHSDDSGGRLTAPNNQLAVRGLVLYEIGLKCCNHLLSKKKSVISRIYFEILSIIYMFKKLLALLPKFLGGLRFLPTDKGPCQDMSQSYSKCIEVLVAGSNFSIAYIVLKIYSMMVWRFYYNQDLVEADYDRPVQYMGMPDSHPLMVLLCGSDSDILRIYYKKENQLVRQMGFCNSLICTQDDSGPIKPFKFEIKVKNIRKGFEEAIETFKEHLESWSIRNVNYHNSAFNFLNFLNKLRDSGFVGSLVNESTVRRFSRSYFIRSNDSLMTKLGNLKISEILNSLRLYQGFMKEDSAISMVLSDILNEGDIEAINKDIADSRNSILANLSVLDATLQSPIRIYKYLDALSMQNRKLSFQPRTLKPTVVQLVKSTPVFSSKFDPNCLVSYVKDIDLRWALPDVRGMFTAELELKEFLQKKGMDIDLLDADSLLKICRDFGPNCTKTIYLYSKVPSELRQVKSYSAFLTFLSVNSFDDLEINGLTLRLNAAEMSTEYTMGSIDDDIYSTVNTLSALCVLYTKIDLDFFKKITLNAIPEVGFHGGCIDDYINHVEIKLGDNVNLSYYVPYLQYLKFILRSFERKADFLYKGAFYTFLKSQRLKSGWYGKGEIYINVENKFYSFMLYNSQVNSVRTNHVGKITQHHSDYIIDILTYNGIAIHNLPKFKATGRTTADGFGFDYSGHLASSTERELLTGVPCTIISHTSAFVDNLHSYDVTSLNGNVLTIRSDIMNKHSSHKIYALPFRKGEIINTYLRILKPIEFEMKLLEQGLDSFEDFIYTELLTEYGNETYVPFDSLIDNFASSKLFQIFTKCRKDSISYIPTVPNFSNFPANEGSLTKILIDYGNHTGESTIKVNRDISPELIQVMSEYPSQMSVILVENLVSSYDRLFDKVEKKEISDEYHNISDSNDPEIIRTSIIKLMTHWGYGGLVNSLQNFTMKRQPRNYLYFNLKGLNADFKHHMSELFVTLINMVFKELLDWQEQYKGLDLPNPRLRNVNGVRNVCELFMKYICVSCYDYVMADRTTELQVVQFNTTVVSFLQDDEFCASLQQRLSSNYILGSIPISYSHRKDFIVTLNTLRHIWSVENKIDYTLSLIKKNERLPDDIPNWKSISRQFVIDTPPTWSMYNGLINVRTVDEILKRGNRVIETRFGKYYIDSHLKEFSNVAVNTCEHFLPIRPIKTSVLESDPWEDFQAEFDFDEVDSFTVEDFLEQLGSIYVQKSTRIEGFGKNKRIFANISWVIGTQQSSRKSQAKFIRQIGQNIIILSTSYMPNLKYYMYNFKTRIIQYTPGEVIYCYISFQNELNNDEFIDKLLGNNRNFIQDQDIELCYSELLRDSDGVIKRNDDIGTFFDEDLMSGQAVIVEEEDISVVKKIEDLGEVELKEPEDSEDDKRLQIFNRIGNLESEGLDKKVCDRLKNKYLGLLNDYKVSFKLIMKSLLDEGSINTLMQDLKEQKLLLSPEEYISTFVAPKHFGASHGLSAQGSKNIKNKSIKAEIESLHEELSNKVGSGVVYISESFKKIVLANLKMWRNMVKNTNYKKENKVFAVLLFTTLLSCAKISMNTVDDPIWQTCLNKMSLVVTEELEDEDSDDLMSLIEDVKSFSRLRYMPKGT